MAKIHLFYLSPNTTGGWVTYTAHLMDALEKAGHRTELHKISSRSETKSRPFGYARQYWNTTHDAAVSLAKRGETCLVVAAAKNFRETTEALLRHNSRIVIHDPTEFNNVDQEMIQPERCVVIRKVGLKHVPKATFIRHPYTRRVQQEDLKPKTVHAVATSRIDFDKNTHLLLDANRLLKASSKTADKAIQIHGFENRLYTKFKIVPKYPEWEQSKCAYPREKRSAFDLLAPAHYLVDMSVIKGDGGGTQYTTLEAWDAGALPLIHDDWVRAEDDMVPGLNCATAGSGLDIAAFLSGALTEKQRTARVHQGQMHLDVHHNPATIGKQYADFLGV